LAREGMEAKLRRLAEAADLDPHATQRLLSEYEDDPDGTKKKGGGLTARPTGHGAPSADLPSLVRM